MIGLATRERVRSFDLGGQPDSITVSKDHRYAAVAIENERDSRVTPADHAKGDLPQPPAGFLQIVDLPTSDPTTWSTRSVALTGPGGAALPVLADAGIVEPTDPEPEYVSINRANQIALTLQENNGVVIVDAATATIRSAFSAGSATIADIDTAKDAIINQSGSINNVREPDALGWVDDRYLATANEGDWHGGTRGWSIFDSRTGAVAWDAGNSVERLAVRYGLHSESCAVNRGLEVEGLTVAEYRGVRYAFVGSECGNFVAVYDLSNPTRPVFRQLLAVASGPEGLLAIPGRDLFAVSSEYDFASYGVRGAVTLFRLGDGAPSFPSLVSADDASGHPIGWGALSALSAVPGQPSRLYAVGDSTYVQTRILTIDTRRAPAVISGELAVSDATGKLVGYDVEGLSARPHGGFWLAAEGKTWTENKLVRLDARGVVQQEIPLPGDVAVGDKGGLAGVAAVTGHGREQVWVVLPGTVANPGVARLGCYDVTDGTWVWYGYQLESTGAPAVWNSLSEITEVGPNRLAVIERDAGAGTAATIKRIYTIEIPRSNPAPGTLPVLQKSLAYDVLADLQATRGWTQEKLEGLTVGADGAVYAVTDNNGLSKLSNGETVFLRLGPAGRVFAPRR